MILLDTHVLVALVLCPERLSKPAARAISRAEASDGIAVASIVFWEIALLIDHRRISVTGSTEAFLRQIAGRPSIYVIDLSPEIAALACQCPAGFPNDPVDRIITATARAHGLALVTKDQRIQESGLVKTLW